MKRKTSLSLIALLLLIASGCSTVPRHSGRKGLFDRLFAHSGGRSRASESELARSEVGRLDRLASRWRAPLKRVQVTSPFGRRKGDPHDGIDLRAQVGTPVFAVDSGTVLYVGSAIGGYGKMVVLRHEGGVSTVYAHNSRYFVKKGQRVARGERIALSGRSGRTRGPHLHFEVRAGITAVDPEALAQGRWLRRKPEGGVTAARTLASHRTRAKDDS